MNWETLLCVGDSITIGSRSYFGYPEYCANFLAKKTNKSWNVLNHAVAGFTTIDLARSIDKSFANLKDAKPDIATILIGTNDLKSNLLPEMFKIAYEQLVVKVQLIVRTNNIMLIEIPKLTDGVMLPYNIEMNKTIIEYNKIVQEIANKNKLIYVQINSNVNHFYDGVHLNETGSEYFGSELADRILKLRNA
ncbi:MAG: SGNH/GDSL hydrolase family protein [Bacteroidia bacterium]|nr:SGNH/GDSL hydrolase family protein [Bacteroidia bacterium]